MSVSQQPRLTRRQRDIAELVGRGLTNRQIAEARSISTHTVRKHVADILIALGVHNRTEVALRMAGLPTRRTRRNETPLQALEAIEWQTATITIEVCPCCQMPKERGHVDCALAAAIRAMRNGNEVGKPSREE